MRKYNKVKNYTLLTKDRKSAVKEWEKKIHHTNTNQKKADIALQISDKVDNKVNY